MLLYDKDLKLMRERLAKIMAQEFTREELEGIKEYFDETDIYDASKTAWISKGGKDE